RRRIGLRRREVLSITRLHSYTPEVWVLFFFSFLFSFFTGRIVKIRSSIAKLFVLGTCLFVFAGSPAQAQDAPPVRDPAPLHLASGSVMLLDLKPDKVLYSRNS